MVSTALQQCTAVQCSTPGQHRMPLRGSRPGVAAATRSNAAGVLRGQPHPSARRASLLTAPRAASTEVSEGEVQAPESLRCACPPAVQGVLLLSRSRPHNLVPALRPPRRLELPTQEAQAALRLATVRQGRGSAIVIAEVAPGSAPAAAGCRPGQQLLAVSDPVRRNEMWRLDGNSSLRYTRQAIRMRVAGDIVLELTAAPIPEWREAVEAAGAAEQAARQAEEGAGEQQEASAAAEQQAAKEEGQGAASPSVEEGEETMAEVLAQRATLLSDVQRRRARRKAYFEQVRGSRAWQLRWALQSKGGATGAPVPEPATHCPAPATLTPAAAKRAQRHALLRLCGAAVCAAAGGHSGDRLFDWLHR